MNKIKNHGHYEPEFSDLLDQSYDSYVKLTKSRAIFVVEDITKKLAADVTALLLHYNEVDPNEEITIYINSNGGDVFAFLNMYDIINLISAPVRTVCLGKAYSAGALLLASGTKGRRFAWKHSSIMIHQVQVLFPLPGDIDHIGSNNYFEFLDKKNNAVIKILANATGVSSDEVLEHCKQDLYMNAQETLNYGIIDSII